MFYNVGTPCRNVTRHTMEIFSKSQASHLSYAEAEEDVEPALYRSKVSPFPLEFHLS